MSHTRQRNAVPYRTVQNWRYIEALNNGDPVPYHGDCSNPRTVEVRGRESDLLTRLRTDLTDYDFGDGRWLYSWPGGLHPEMPPFRDPKTATAYLTVRCRKCVECRAAKSRLWAARAHAECKASIRTWFVTLTVHPGHRFSMEMAAQKRLQDRFADQPSDEQYRLLCEQLGPHCTRWLKRVRKTSGARFRYLLVTEPHADGFPHVHALIHERSGSVTERAIRSAWWLSKVSQAKLVDQFDPRSAWYVSKYIAKYSQTRVRASLRYGQIAISDLISEHV